LAQITGVCINLTKSLIREAVWPTVFAKFNEGGQGFANNLALFQCGLFSFNEGLFNQNPRQIGDEISDDNKVYQVAPFACIPALYK
jgi:hypothetical protein